MAAGGGVGSVSIPCMTPSGADDCLTPSWHALDEWANVLDSVLVPYVVQCLSQVLEGPWRGLQLSDPTFQDILQMFNWVEVRTICWPLQRRNLNRPKVVAHTLGFVWSCIVMHYNERASDVGGHMARHMVRGCL